MSSARDDIAVSGIGIQSIVPIATPRRVTKRNPDEDPDNRDSGTTSDHTSPHSAPAPGTGRLVDKVV
jgi:hypothetical protein